MVEWRKTLNIAGRTALLLGRAGDHSLAERLRDDSGLSLDLTLRFGEELLQVVDTLEGLGIAQLATVDTTIADLGYGIEAQNVLEGMGIHSVRDLLAVERVKFRYLTGVGDRIRREIRLKAKRLAQLRPDLAQGRSTLHGIDNAGPGVACIDALAALLLPKRPAGDDRPEERALALYLGLEQAEAEPGSDIRWPSLGDAARLGAARKIAQ